MSDNTDHEFIWLQPECCADPDSGRLWCQDPDPEDCEDGNVWTKYVRADRIEELEAEIARLRQVIEVAFDDLDSNNESSAYAVLKNNRGCSPSQVEDKA